jgi:membrane-bound lytic murein transglycosylase A
MGCTQGPDRSSFDEGGSPPRRPENIVHQTMKTSNARAAKASSNKIHMRSGYRRIFVRRAMPVRRLGLLVAAAVLSAFVAACSTPHRTPSSKPGVEVRERSLSAPSDPRSSGSAQHAGDPNLLNNLPAGVPVGERFERSGAVWVRVPWQELPGFQDDPAGEMLRALLGGCARAPSVWQTACERARALDPTDHQAVRRWMVQHLQPWRIEDRSGARQGLLTGYYEPHFEARRRPDAQFNAPLHRPPADLAARKPYWTRQQLDTVREARESLRGREIAYLRDPIDVLVLQIQGSGRLTVTEPDGRQRTVRLGFAAHNDHPYGSVGRWLIDQGHLNAAQATWPGIKDWMQRNPRRVQEALWKNPRVVFFREEPLTDPEVGPRGAMGVPLTPQRSIAVDARSVPYGTAVWIHSAAPATVRDPALQAAQSLQRVVVAQDTGSAIVGAVRGDYFWGWGDEAGEQAGRMRGRLQMWALWPVGQRPPP